ncbi:CocE/NonD family hydrolase [Streptomyces sp. SID486]|uniref:CocE/NonD family hydrolase n=1 Tax=Streptomyces sp. SID486 TaxID=2690264 RepID=UPI0013709BB6|nr:CocE/NonD family hydrolase [Streptomyces sp. SID486]MYX93787.1 CocE/NonD family hydrolase [Streptomyces sp. SID486]
MPGQARSTVNRTISGTERGQRRLNGPQTSGRDYRNLSCAQHGVVTELNVSIPMRDGVNLLADIRRPEKPGAYPVLISASPYPRQLQDVLVPLGVVEAGMDDFFVPRGYVHVTVNERGTNDSGGRWTIFDSAERQDLYDVVEWAGTQSWSSGAVGMLGISYFAMAQLGAAVAAPPHLKAIFPLGLSSDLYELVWHGGLLNSAFISGWTTMLGIATTRSDKMLRGPAVAALRKIFQHPGLHAKLQHTNGEAALATLQRFARGTYPADPWDELWQNLAVERPFRDEWWQERNLLEKLADVKVPVYLGCEWDNTPVHLPSTFDTWDGFQRLSDESRPPVRMTLLGEGGLGWPWESMHVEALAWFDHWLKGQDTGILEGPPVRYFLPEADQWRTSETWPPADSRLASFHLASDGVLSRHGGTEGSRRYLAHGERIDRSKAAHKPDFPAALSWTTPALTTELDFAGNIELQMDAAITDADTSWIIALEDVAPDGSATFITAGWQRAALRTVNEERSVPGRPVLDCDTPIAVPPNKSVRYRIPLCPNARRLHAGHSLRLTVGSSDATGAVPSNMGFTHLAAGGPSINTVFATSTLLLPLLP